MKGIHKVIVTSKRLRYEFELRRNLTIIRGDSASGKTTLIGMIQEYGEHPSGSPVEVVCDKTCYVLAGNLWKEQLAAMKDSIVFIDEGNEFVRTVEFARAIQDTDNYYVIVSRESLPALPYSVEEIYGIRTSGRYGSLRQVYHEFYRIYGWNIRPGRTIYPKAVLTEDSNSGYQFFRAICEACGFTCVCAGGKSNIFHQLLVHEKDRLLIVADGASFGPEIDRVMQLLRDRTEAVLYLPESFEWLILASGILRDKEVQEILEHPSDHIDSKQYFNWERFFTNLLIEKTSGSFMAYSKKALNPAYLAEKARSAILLQMHPIVFDGGLGGIS